LVTVPPALREAVYQKHVWVAVSVDEDGWVKGKGTVIVNIFNVLRRANRRAVAVTCIIVATVELVHDECCAVTAYVLDFCELGVGDYLSCRVSRVARQDYRGSPGNLFCDLIRVDVVAICFGERNGYRCKLCLY